MRGDRGACSECGMVGNVGAELVEDGAGFRCENERRCEQRRQRIIAMSERVQRGELG